MQIDFHHAVTYVASRLAGLDHKQADVVAYAAQYVDDATNAGYVRFDNGATYSRLATAHKMLDYSNFDALANHRAWAPFHFLPGNDGKKAEESHEGRFVHRLVCRPGSYVAEDMARDCILDRRRPYGLHRLGITMHVYIDTWSHQGFCGMAHAINRANKITILQADGTEERDRKITQRLAGFFKGAFDNAASDFVDGVQPLGHGSVLSYPDMPYLRWKYVNGLGEPVARDNPTDFMAAVQAMYRAVARFRLGDPYAPVPPMPEEDRRTIETFIRTFLDDNGDTRHKKWLDAVADGAFSFGKQAVSYIPKGEGSWKHKALDTTKSTDEKGEIFPYRESFLTSDWKMFHDAALAHQFNVLRHILPRYGICIG
jgi:hypothetical protein